jgi:hypothetical protein
VNLVSIGTPICLKTAETELLVASTFKGAACAVTVNAAQKANTIQLNTIGF